MRVVDKHICLSRIVKKGVRHMMGVFCWTAGVVVEQDALKAQLDEYVAGPLLAAALPSSVSTANPLPHLLTLGGACQPSS